MLEELLPVLGCSEVGLRDIFIFIHLVDDVDHGFDVLDDLPDDFYLLVRLNLTGNELLPE